MAVNGKTSDIPKFHDVGILGLPFNKGQPKPGVKYGPEEIRKANLTEGIKDLERDVKDYGDVLFDDIEDDPPHNGVKNPRNVGNANKKISDAVSQVIQDGRLCISLGGDHSVAIGTIHGHLKAQPNTCVLWIDAHADINTPLTSPSGNIHGMPLSFLIHELRDSVKDVPGFDWLSPCIHAKDVAYIGARDVDSGEKKTIEDLGMKCFSVRDVDILGLKEVLKGVMNAINPNNDKYYHISFDIDALDPTVAYSTGTKAYGGLTSREGMYIVEEVWRTGKLSGIDMVEVNPTLGGDIEKEVTVNTAVEVLLAALGKR
ncbi:arginase, hepatic-like [Ptychodera flava]|uniref:arginase, hepatic-like n=1 Tax=Ptychodera flava TaxID=63121 RepID=UPI00396AB0C9